MSMFLSVLQCRICLASCVLDSAVRSVVRFPDAVNNWGRSLSPFFNTMQVLSQWSMTHSQLCQYIRQTSWVLYSGKFPKFLHVPDVLRRSHDLMVSVFQFPQLHFSFHNIVSEFQFLPVCDPHHTLLFFSVLWLTIVLLFFRNCGEQLPYCFPDL